VQKIISKLLVMLISVNLLCLKFTGVILHAEPQISAPSAILIEASTGTVIYENNADERLHPASVTKIMTLILIFDALESGKISLEDEVTVSEYAASMGGSQVYLEAGEKQTVETMIKCIAVASANDASVAMAEYVWGSESEFVAKMNERAKGLNMSGTNFVNCCGLDEDEHLMTARDIALMSRELITKYPQIHNYSGIWMDTITHTTKRGSSEFGLTNTNKLMKQYEWATGLKTGSTSLAKCCLSATADRNGIELIAVIMAAPTSKDRFADAISLLNYGYGICNLYVDENGPVIPKVSVKGGKKEEITAISEKEFTHLFVNSENTDNITSHIEMLENITAPVAIGDVLGSIIYEIDGNVIGTVDIIAAEEAPKAVYTDYLKNILQIWGDMI
jgi:D-alanyl-D-alanine carboxypeptidase (penicillin-binding protein 5/6)